jgi:hypothetical protein
MVIIKETKWIRFVLVQEGPKTNVYSITAKEGDAHLGIIHWYGRWRQYGFFPAPHTVFEKTCLADISAFLKELMEARKKNEGALDKNRPDTPA